MKALLFGVFVAVPALIFAAAAWELVRVGRDAPLDAALLGVFAVCVACGYATAMADLFSGRARPRRAPGVVVPRWIRRVLFGAVAAVFGAGLLSAALPDARWPVTLVHAAFACTGVAMLVLARAVSRRLRAERRALDAGPGP